MNQSMYHVPQDILTPNYIPPHLLLLPASREARPISDFLTSRCLLPASCFRAAWTPSWHDARSSSSGGNRHKAVRLNREKGKSPKLSKGSLFCQLSGWVGHCRSESRASGGQGTSPSGISDPRQSPNPGKDGSAPKWHRNSRGQALKVP